MVSHKPTDGGQPAQGPASGSGGRAPALRRAADRLALRPMARVERIALIEREIRERLSKAAIDILFACAEVISEGQRQVRDGRDTWFGSTMLTVDLAPLVAVLSDRCDAGTARRLVRLLATDVNVAARAKVLAAAEAARLIGSRPRTLEMELSVNARGARVFLDIDVEATP